MSIISIAKSMYAAIKKIYKISPSWIELWFLPLTFYYFNFTYSPYKHGN